MSACKCRFTLYAITCTWTLDPLLISGTRSVGSFLFVQNIPTLAHTPTSTAALCCIVCTSAATVAGRRVLLEKERVRKSQRGDICCSVRVGGKKWSLHASQFSLERLSLDAESINRNLKANSEIYENARDFVSSHTVRKNTQDVEIKRFWCINLQYCIKQLDLCYVFCWVVYIQCYTVRFKRREILSLLQVTVLLGHCCYIPALGSQ